MSATEESTVEELKISPLHRGEFGADQHKVKRFNAFVPGVYTIAELENPEFWANVAHSMEVGCEVRCLAKDMSFVARGICTFQQGSTAKIKIFEFHKLDEVDYEALSDEASDYLVKFRGPRKWSIIKKSTGEVVKEDISDQTKAYKELDDYKAALRR
jgi:hypothetical protein